MDRNKKIAAVVTAIGIIVLLVLFNSFSTQKQTQEKLEAIGLSKADAEALSKATPEEIEKEKEKAQKFFNKKPKTFEKM